MADDVAIIITVDLDKDSLDKSFVELSKESEKSAKAVGNNYEKALGQTFNKQLVGDIDKTNESLGTLTKSFGLLSRNIGTILTVGIVLERQFGIFSSAFARVGLDLDSLIDKFTGLRGSFQGFKTGEVGFGRLKLSAASLLQEVGLVDSKLLTLINTFSSISVGVKAFGEIAAQLSAVAVFIGPIAANFREVSKLVAGITAVVLKSGGIFGAVSALGGISLGLGALAQSLKEYDSNLVKAIRSTLLFGSIITGSLAGAIAFAIVKVSELGEKLGRNLAEGFQKASNNFAIADSRAKVFAKTVENFDKVTAGAVGSTESWTEELSKLNEELNVKGSLTAAAQEIIAVGSQAGLTGDQLKELTRVAAEYAKVNDKDVFKVSVALVGALNGNAQAVQALGIKLNEATVQAFAYKKGINENIRSLASNEVVQLRFNKLLSQFSNISGIAAVAAGSLADQQKRLEANQKRLSVELGKGAALIEQNNILAAAYNLILNNVNDNVIAVTGFFGALGARLLQFGSIILGLSFKVFGLVKVFKILQVILRNQTSINLFAQQIPIVNNSLNGLLSNLAQTNVRVKDFKSLLVGLRGILKQTANSFLLFTTGKGLGSITLLGSITGLLGKLKIALVVASKALIAFITPLLPFIAVAAAIGTVVTIIVKAFQKLEERTGALSTIFNVLKEVFLEGASFFQPVLDIFNDLSDSIVTLASKGFGLLITALSKVISSILDLAKTPFFSKFFNEEQLKRLDVASNKLNTLSNDLTKVAFDFRKLGKDAEDSGRKIASSFKKIRPEDLASLQNELKDVGKSQLQVLTETRDARIKLLEGGLRQGLLNQVRFEQLSLKVLKDFSLQREEILRQQREKELQKQQQLRDSILSIQNELANFGLTELEKLDLQQEQRLLKVEEALNAEVLTIMEAEQLKTDIVQNANKQREDVLNRSLKNMNRALNQQLKGAAVNIVGSAFAEIGKTLAGAGGGFKAFLGLVIGILGDMAISIGKTIIASAIAIDALKKSLVGSPLAAVALGGALIAIGSILKAKSGSSADSGFSSPSGGGASGFGGSGFDQDQTTSPDAERESPSVVFQTTVQGDILDSSDTRKRLFNIFQEGAEEEGIELGQGIFAT